MLRSSTVALLCCGALHSHAGRAHLDSRAAPLTLSTDALKIELSAQGAVVGVPNPLNRRLKILPPILQAFDSTETALIRRPEQVWDRLAERNVVLNGSAAYPFMPVV